MRKNVRSPLHGWDMSNDERKKISRNLTEKFREFITQHSPSIFSRHLRNILLDYIAQQEKTGLPPDFHTYMWEFYDLFDLLDCATDEWEFKKEKKSD